MRIIIQWLVSAIAIVISAYVIPEVTVDTFITALIVAAVLGGLNLILRPLLLFLTLPINFLTLGLFTFVVNACLIWITTWIVPGFSIGNFGWAIVFAVVLSVVSLIFHTIGGKKDQQAPPAAPPTPTSSNSSGAA
jgi:putative membrane protein